MDAVSSGCLNTAACKPISNWQNAVADVVGFFPSAAVHYIQCLLLMLCLVEAYSFNRLLLFVIIMDFNIYCLI